MRQGTQEKVERVRARINAGESIDSACKAEQMSAATWQKYGKNAAKPGLKRGKPKPQILQVPVADLPSEKIIALVGSPQMIARTLGL